MAVKKEWERLEPMGMLRKVPIKGNRWNRIKKENN